MLFNCTVRTMRGQEDINIELHAINQGVAQDRALARATAMGLTPNGRCRATKIQPRRGVR